MICKQWGRELAVTSQLLGIAPLPSPWLQGTQGGPLEAIGATLLGCCLTFPSSRSDWWFPKSWGGTPKSSIYRWILLGKSSIYRWIFYKPSSYWAPPFLDTPTVPLLETCASHHLTTSDANDKQFFLCVYLPSGKLR
jgi:hypothetical protein